MEYLIDSWSYSGVSTFSRNEKAFEMQYIYRMGFKKSATTVAGTAYHKGLQAFFSALQDGENVDLACCGSYAFEEIELTPANSWKLQKTSPSIEECQQKAFKTTSLLLNNFFSEIGIYTEDIAEVLDVEIKLSENISINGVEIPIVCHCVIDLVVKTKSGKVIIIDHKSKSVFSDDEEIAFTIGKQAMTYVKCYEKISNVTVDEVWFVENKYSKNKSGEPQIQVFKAELNEDTRKLYEALLYEPLRRMVEAVSNPDYVYMMNDTDNLTDRAEMYEFWSRTMIAEIDDFPNVPDNIKPLISKRLKKIRDASLSTINPSVIRKFNENAAAFITYDLSNKDMTNAERIQHILRTFGIVVSVEHTFSGYSSDTMLLKTTAGTKISTVSRYKLDIANALDVPNIRIPSDLMVYNGASYLAIESPKTRDKDLMFDKNYLSELKIPIGMDNFNQPVVWDLNNHSTPHVLVCGATGSGKSVCIKSTIEYAKLAGISDVIIFDPKYEFTKYSKKGIEVINDILDIEERLSSLVEEMEGRVKSGVSKKKMIIFDEFADAVANSRKGKELDIIEEVQVGYYAPKKLKGAFGETMSEAEPKYAMQKTGELKSIEENLRILLQKGRSLGFRIMAATQRASTKVITGDAKVNFPVQICFRVPKEQDSRVVIDEAGAESLAGRGDGLMRSPEYLDIVRFQAFYKAD